MKPAIVMINGGSRPLVVACKAVDKGYDIIPVECFVKYFGDRERTRYMFWEMQEIFGKKHVRSLSQVDCTEHYDRYMSLFVNGDLTDFTRKYPSLRFATLSELCQRAASFTELLRFSLLRQMDKVMIDDMACNNELLHDEFIELMQEGGVNIDSPIYDRKTMETCKKILQDHGFSRSGLKDFREAFSRSEYASAQLFFKKELRDLIIEEVRCM